MSVQKKSLDSSNGARTRKGTYAKRTASAKMAVPRGQKVSSMKTAATPSPVTSASTGAGAGKATFKEF